jgi:hypothetical protein
MIHKMNHAYKVVFFLTLPPWFGLVWWDSLSNDHLPNVYTKQQPKCIHIYYVSNDRSNQQRYLKQNFTCNTLTFTLTIFAWPQFPITREYFKPLVMVLAFTAQAKLISLPLSTHFSPTNTY